MAGLVFRQTVGAYALGGSSADTTLMQVIAPTNQRLKVREFGVSFKGQTNTNAPVRIRLMYQTTAGTASAGTLVKVDPGNDETIQSTSRITYTIEPTYGNVIWEGYVHPQTGMVLPFSLINPPIVAGGTRVALVATAADAVTLGAYMELEE